MSQRSINQEIPHEDPIHDVPGLIGIVERLALSDASRKKQAYHDNQDNGGPTQQLSEAGPVGLTYQWRGIDRHA